MFFLLFPACGPYVHKLQFHYKQGYEVLNMSLLSWICIGITSRPSLLNLQLYSRCLTAQPSVWSGLISGECHNLSRHMREPQLTKPSEAHLRNTKHTRQGRNLPQTWLYSRQEIQKNILIGATRNKPESLFKLSVFKAPPAEGLGRPLFQPKRFFHFSYIIQFLPGKQLHFLRHLLTIRRSKCFFYYFRLAAHMSISCSFTINRVTKF